MIRGGPGRLSGLALLTDAIEWVDSLVFRGVKSVPIAFR